MNQTFLTNPKLLLSSASPRSSRHTIRHFIEAMRRHDPMLVEHGKRTAVYSLLVGQALGLSEEDLSDVCHAALLHDLGKLTLPNEVRNQNGLSIIGDYLMTECSPQAGAEILRSWPDLQRVAKLIALHHERWDGSGFPFGMRGLLIPLGARILSLTDTVDQLLSQKEIPIQHQIDTLFRVLRTLSCTRFDPRIVEAFVEVFVPWIEYIDTHFASDGLWSTEPLQSPSVQTFSEFWLLRSDDGFFQTKPGSSFEIHLREIFELTNTVVYDSTPASLVR